MDQAIYEFNEDLRLSLVEQRMAEIKQVCSHRCCSVFSAAVVVAAGWQWYAYSVCTGLTTAAEVARVQGGNGQSPLVVNSGLQPRGMARRGAPSPARASAR